MDVITYVVSAMCVLNDNIVDNSEEDLERPRKCQHYNYDHSHAKAAVWNDYLNPFALFNDKQFQRIFHVSKAIFKTITVLKHPFFQKKSIAVEGRLLGPMSNS